MKTRLMASSLVCLGLFLVGGTASAGEVPAGEPVPLRSVVFRLTDALGEARVEPPITLRPPLGRLQKAATRLEYTDAPEEFRDALVQLELWGRAPGRVEQREALLFDVPRTFRFRLKLPPDPRLEFGYAWVGPVGPPSDAQLTVTVTAPGGEPARWTVSLGDRADLSLPWRDVAVDLPYHGERLVDLELRFEDGGEGGRRRARTIAWAAPVLTGRVLPGTAASDRNVLFLVLDAVRGDVVGPGRVLSDSVAPYTEALMAQGVSFSNSFSAANRTRSSTLSMLQSQPPSVGKFWSMFWSLTPWAKKEYYDQKPPLLTRALVGEGWRVTHIGSNHFLFPNTVIGLDHGFERIVDVRGSENLCEKLTEHGIEFLRHHKDDRWFLFLNYTSAHVPYDPPEGYEGRVKRLLPVEIPGDISAKYLAEIAYIDDHVRTILGELVDLGLDTRTLVVVTADHGEVFSKHHKCWSKTFEMVCRNSHGLTLYDEEMHVPLSFTLRDDVPGEIVVEEAVSLLDLAPTVLACLGLPSNPRHVGRSLVPAFSGEPLESCPIYAEGRAVTALRERGMKLMLHHPRDDAWTPARTGRSEARPFAQLFDVMSDPGETRNLALEEDLRLPRMQQRLEQVREDLASRARGLDSAEGGGAGAPESPDLAREDDDLLSWGSAHNVVMVVSDGRPRRLTGEIEIVGTGAIECSSDDLGYSCESVSEGRVRVDLAVDERPSTLAFRTTPWDVGISMRLEFDGDPVSLEHLRVGRAGVALLGTRTSLAEAEGLRLASTIHAPLVSSIEEHGGVYYWRSPPPAWLTNWGTSCEDEAATGVFAALGAGGGLGPDDALSDDLRDVLTALGYTAALPKEGEEPDRQAD